MVLKHVLLAKPYPKLIANHTLSVKLRSTALLIHFAEEYPNATCYWIQIIAKRSIDELWEGSFNGKHYAHPRVRKISADRFYALVTGIPDAFYQLCAVLPQATKDYLDSLNNNSQGKTESASVYSELNTKAQQNGKTLIEQIMADNFETYTGFNQ